MRYEHRLFSHRKCDPKKLYNYAKKQTSVSFQIRSVKKPQDFIDKSDEEKADVFLAYFVSVSISDSNRIPYNKRQLC